MRSDLSKQERQRCLIEFKWTTEMASNPAFIIGRGGMGPGSSISGTAQTIEVDDE